MMESLSCDSPWWLKSMINLVHTCPFQFLFILIDLLGIAPISFLAYMSMYVFLMTSTMVWYLVQALQKLIMLSVTGFRHLNFVLSPFTLLWCLGCTGSWISVYWLVTEFATLSERFLSILFVTTSNRYLIQANHLPLVILLRYLN